MKSRRTFISIAAGACAALLLVAWLAFAPAELGGSLQYVTTTGDSMEPEFSDGDLALLRALQEYEPGDVVAYRHPQHGIVLHRIVETDGERFVVKGDNNGTADAYTPVSDDIVGAVWARIPAAGGAITGGATHWLRIGAAVVVGLFALIPLGVAFPRSTSRGGWRAPDVGAMFRPSRFLGLLGQTGQVLVALLTFTAIAGLVLAFLSFNRSLERAVVVPVEYEQVASVSYSASADGSVYAQGAVNAGDPVYRAVVDELTIQLDHQVVSDGQVNGDGSYWIDAVVQASDGWQYSLPLREPTPYSGAALDTTVNLPLDPVDEAVDAFRTETGLDSIDALTFSILVAASVSFDGTIAGEVVHTVTSDELLLQWNQDVLYPEALPPGEDETSSGAVETTRSAANRLDLGLLDIEVGTARVIAQIMLFVALLGGLIVLLLMRRALETPEPMQIAARYRTRIVPIQGARQPTPTRVVALLSFDDLLRVSDQKQEPILYFRRNEAHYYYVQTADTIYRVKIETGPEDRDLTVATDT